MRECVELKTYWGIFVRKEVKNFHDYRIMRVFRGLIDYPDDTIKIVSIEQCQNCGRFRTMLYNNSDITYGVNYEVSDRV